MDKLVIEETKAFKFGGTAYLTREEAQRAALASIPGTHSDNDGAQFAVWAMNHKDEVVAILTGAKPRRRRSDAGKPHAKPVKIPAIRNMPVDGGKFPESAGVTIEPSSKYKGK